MKTQNENHKYVTLLNELNRAFDHFNLTFAGGKLRRPLIMVAPTGSRLQSELGWFGHKHWKDGKEDMHEINISAELLHKGPDEVLHTLLHEMAHLKNAQAGIKDCTITQYHNKAYKIAAESFGLEVDRVGYRGYAKTSLGDNARAAIKELNIDPATFSIYKKKLPRKYEDRYIPLIVSKGKKIEKKIEKLSADYPSKREMVEEAIALLYAQRQSKKVEKPQLA